MTEFKRILCPVDLSDTSARALDYAFMLARWYEAPLEALEVVWAAVPPMPGVAPPVVTTEQLAETTAALEGFVRTRDTTGVEVTCTVRHGPVVTEILEVAKETATDLIVLGTHGRSTFERLMIGSVAERILRKASCPVFTVPHASIAAPRKAGPFEAILCPLDFSPASEKTARVALSLAEESGKKIVLLHVFDWPKEKSVPVGFGPDMSAERHQLQAGALTELRRYVADEARVWCTVEEQLAVGRPYEEILRVAEEQHADLIVMGVHARRGLQLGFFGSTTNQVVRHAKCPVLTMRP
jgi:nucleotide-binding universal stress UspA family protein